MRRMNESEETKLLAEHVADIKRQILEKELEIAQGTSTERAILLTLLVLFTFVTGVGIGGMVFH